MPMAKGEVKGQGEEKQLAEARPASVGPRPGCDSAPCAPGSCARGTLLKLLGCRLETSMGHSSSGVAAEDAVRARRTSAGPQGGGDWGLADSHQQYGWES